jgi:hypothetical protein
VNGSGDYGVRLTDEEYERRIIDLQRAMPPMPTAEEDRARRRRELDLAVDYRLGQDFPQARRDELWAAAERVESKRVSLGARYLLDMLIAPLRRQHATALTRMLSREYSKVLTPPELRAFLGLGKGGEPTLPVDTESN